MGLALGAGFYEGAIIGFCAIVFTLIIMRRIQSVYYKHHPREKCLSVRLAAITDLQYIIKLLKAWGVAVSSTNLDNPAEESGDSTGFTAVMNVIMKNDVDSNMVLMNLLQESCVLYADYIPQPLT